MNVPRQLNNKAHERVQALADTPSSALCCHSNKTRAPIANPPNSAQQGGTAYHFPKLHPDPSVVRECVEGQTGTRRRA